MRHNKLIFLLPALLLLCGLGHAADEARLQKISEHVYAYVGTTTPTAATGFGANAGVVIGKEEPRSYTKKDGKNGVRANLMIGDETGKIRLTLWDERVSDADSLGIGDVVEVYNAYAREWNGHVEASLGYKGSIQKSERDVKYTVKTTKIGDIGPDMVVSIKGTVTGIDQMKDFTRKDGTAGRLCPVWVSDESGRIRVTFWGEQADMAGALNVGTRSPCPTPRRRRTCAATSN
jgi:replication factor A1